MTSPTPSTSDSQQIGAYRTLRELGRGGQAIVWLAEDSRIGRQVALKVLPHLGPGGEEAMRRFRREAEVTARLEHPAICGVLEADLDRGTPYIAMRYVAGETLARRLAVARETGDEPPRAEALRELARFVETCARALHLAHEAGIVHRDVKPANLMVTPEGEPVILDFGLAREDDGAGQSLTGEASGTPAYMSPEQMTNRARPDRRSDVWSLGVALYEAATLAHPFAAATREALFQTILTAEPPDPRRANRAIDRDFATILETATAKERDRRYQTALDLAEDLRRWRANEPIRARPAGRFERLARWAQRNPALAASGAAILLLAVAAVALGAYGAGAAGRADVEAGLRAEAEQARAVADRERAEAVEARAVADRERALAEEARAVADTARSALVQVRADRALSDELDELDMLMGTLWIGLRDVKTVSALRPRFLAAFRAFGADLERDVEGSIERLAALRARNAELWPVVQSSLENLASIAESDPSPEATGSRSSALAVLAAFPEASWAELAVAEERWSAEGVDVFDALVTDEALAGKSSEELYRVAGALLLVPGRLDDAGRVLERALERDPGSFRVHFLVGALEFMRVAETMANGPDASRPAAEKLLHHMSVAVALRPRSGFVRAMLANAFATNQRYDEAQRTMDEATDLEPENALVWFLRARFYGFTPSPQVGVEACKKALELDPTLGGAAELLAELEAKVKG